MADYEEERAIDLSAPAASQPFRGETKILATCDQGALKIEPRKFRSELWIMVRREGSGGLALRASAGQRLPDPPAPRPASLSPTCGLSTVMSQHSPRSTAASTRAFLPAVASSWLGFGRGPDRAMGMAQGSRPPRRTINAGAAVPFA